MKKTILITVLSFILLFAVGAFCFAENIGDEAQTSETTAQTTEEPKVQEIYNEDGKLVKVIVPEGIKMIWAKGKYSYSREKELREVEFQGNTLKKIKFLTFYDTVKLEYIDFPSSLKLIDRKAFSRSGLKKVRIPGKCRLESSSFEDCHKLKKVVFEDRENDDRLFAGHSFYGCDKLEKVYLPKVSTGFCISTQDFANCKSLKRVYRMDNVTTIWNSSFENCTSLTRFTIPEGIEFIHKSAFAGCTSLKKIKILATTDDFLKAKDGALFLKKLPKACTIFVKNKLMKKAVINGGFRGSVVIKAEM